MKNSSFSSGSVTRHPHAVAAYDLRTIALQALRVAGHQTGHGFVLRQGREEFPGTARPGHRGARRIEGDAQIPQIAGRTGGCHHEDRSAIRRVFHDGVGAILGAGAEIGVGMAAHDDIHAVDAAGQLPVPFQPQMGHDDDMPDALSLQLGDVLLQCCPRIPERGPGAGGRQSGDFVIGQSDDAHPGPAYRPDEIGAYAAPGQRAALLRRQIGGQHRQGLGLQETGQFAASFVELMIAQGHGVVGQQRVRSGDHGPFVDAVEQGALELVARVQGDDVVLLLPGSLDGCADASQAAAAVRGLETGVHVLIDTGKKGMGIIHVQEAQLQTCIRGCLAVRRSAGNHEEEKSTEEGRERQEPHSFP